MKLAKRSDHTKRYGRPKKTDLACTILTKCDVHWGAYIHPLQNRSFTVREAARLAFTDVPSHSAVVVADWSRSNFGQLPYPKWGEVVFE